MPFDWARVLLAHGGSGEVTAGVRQGDILAGKYRVERVLGAGGMGVVVAACHLQLHQKVAIKFLLPEALSNAVPGPFVEGTFTDNIGFSGWDVINARLGLDVRSTAGVAWAPFIGANLQTFIWANSTALSTVQWGTFLYAGLQARFDAGGSRTNVASARSGFSAE